MDFMKLFRKNQLSPTMVVVTNEFSREEQAIQKLVELTKAGRVSWGSNQNKKMFSSTVYSKNLILHHTATANQYMNWYNLSLQIVEQYGSKADNNILYTFKVRESILNDLWQAVHDIVEESSGYKDLIEFLNRKIEE